MAEKILIIRMMDSYDVAAIGVPAVRHMQRCFPQAEIHFLTFDTGIEIMQLAEPDVTTYGLEATEWPEDFVAAMELFLELAEIIDSHNYTEIINLDTCFMPCFLARFLKDAGKPVMGNMLNRSVQELVSQFKQQTLSPEYVNSSTQYLHSTWSGMHQWHENWWLHGEPPAQGYPEFYLRRCCGFADIEMDMSIAVDAASMAGNQQERVAFALTGFSSTDTYPFADELEKALADKGVSVWRGLDDAGNVANKLAELKSCQLLVTIPSGVQWFATAVGTPVLLLSGRVHPQTIMPDFATDMSELPVSVNSLVDGVLAILKGNVDA